MPAKKFKSTRLKGLQKSLSPHETSLKGLQKLSPHEKSLRDKPTALNPEKSLSPHPHFPEILQKRLSPYAAKKKRGDNSAKKSKSTRDKSNLPAELPPLPFFAPCGNVTKVTPPFLSSGDRPRLPSTKGNLGRPSQFALHRGQSGTILARGGHSGMLSASVPGCPPLLLRSLFRSSARPIFFQRIDDSHCDRIHSSLTSSIYRRELAQFI